MKLPLMLLWKGTSAPVSPLWGTMPLPCTHSPPCLFLPQINQNESNTFSKLLLLKWIFLWLLMLSIYRWTKEIAKFTLPRLALIHSTCSSNRQPELKVTHPNTPTPLPRFKNVIFRHHYVMQKNSGCTETEQHCLCRILHLNYENLMLISPPND